MFVFHLVMFQNIHTKIIIRLKYDWKNVLFKYIGYNLNKVAIIRYQHKPDIIVMYLQKLSPHCAIIIIIRIAWKLKHQKNRDNAIATFYDDIPCQKRSQTTQQTHVFITLRYALIFHYLVLAVSLNYKLRSHSMTNVREIFGRFLFSLYATHIVKKIPLTYKILYILHVIYVYR